MQVQIIADDLCIFCLVKVPQLVVCLCRMMWKHFPSFFFKSLSSHIHCHQVKCSQVSYQMRRHAHTVQHLMQYWHSAFTKAGISEPEESVQHIMSASLKCERVQLPSMAKDEITAEQLKDLERRCVCRLQRMPVQYIVGDWEFCDVTLAVRPPVFIPRPETELLARLAADRLRDGRGARLLDVGCGSGAFAVAVLRWLSAVSAVAVDQSEAALALTEENAVRTGVAERLQTRLGSLTADGLPETGGDLFDVVVSNPPYITVEEMAQLQPEILLYEDVAALDGGSDGLRVTRHLVDHAAGWLRPGGTLLLEVAAGQTVAVERLMAASRQLRHVQTHPDFTGRQRFVEARRVEPAVGSMA